jgi:hypothetical protein
VRPCPSDQIGPLTPRIALLAAIYSAGWGLAVAVYLSHSQPRVRPSFVNAFFVSLSPIPFILNLPTFSLASVQVTRIWLRFEDIRAALRPSAASWTPGQPFKLQMDWLPLLESFDQAGAAYWPLIDNAATTHLVGHVLVAMIYGPAAFYYFKVLQRQLNRPTPYGVGSSTSTNSLDSRLSRLRSTYSGMAFEAVAILLSALTLSAVCIW